MQIKKEKHGQIRNIRLKTEAEEVSEDATLAHWLRIEEEIRRQEAAAERSENAEGT